MAVEEVDELGLCLLSSSMEVKVDPMVVVSCDVELLQSPMRTAANNFLPGCWLVEVRSLNLFKVV